MLTWPGAPTTNPNSKLSSGGLRGADANTANVLAGIEAVPPAAFVSPMPLPLVVTGGRAPTWTFSEAVNDDGVAEAAPAVARRATAATKLNNFRIEEPPYRTSLDRQSKRHP